MAIAAKLKSYLEENNVPYETLAHPEAYTAQEVAAVTHIRGQDLAKTVIVKKEGEFVMVVLPASYKLDFKLLKGALGAQKAELASEQEFKSLFPDCEAGAMPPFGNLYNLPVYVDEHLTLDESIAFNAGTHKEVIKMRYQEFERLVQPKIVRCSVPFHMAPAGGTA